jgi:hypothetical protein
MEKHSGLCYFSRVKIRSVVSVSGSARITQRSARSAALAMKRLRGANIKISSRTRQKFLGHFGFDGVPMAKIGEAHGREPIKRRQKAS